MFVTSGALCREMGQPWLALLDSHLDRFLQQQMAVDIVCTMALSSVLQMQGVPRVQAHARLAEARWVLSTCLLPS